MYELVSACCSTRLVIRFIIIGLPGNDSCPRLSLCIPLWWGQQAFRCLRSILSWQHLSKKQGERRGPSAGSTLGWERRKGEGRVKDACLNKACGELFRQIFPVRHLPLIISTPWDCVALAILWWVQQQINESSTGSSDIIEPQRGKDFAW